MEFILVRHGETTANQKGVCHGWMDTTLTHKGIAQAELLRDLLKHEDITTIHSSPLKRCVQTADIINQYHKLDVVKVENLKEINFGIWDGMHYRDIKGQFPLEVKKWEKDWKNFKVPQGERGRDFYSRVSLWLDKFITIKTQGTHLIVTHGGCIRVMLSHLIGKGIDGYWNFHIKTGGMARVKFDGDLPYLVYLN